MRVILIQRAALMMASCAASWLLEGSRLEYSMFRRAPVPYRPHAVSELLPPELAMVMLRLRKAGIPCDIHVDQAIAVSLGNEDVGPSAQATFPLEASRRAAQWLHRSALILFERNGYSLRYSRRFDPISVLAQLWRPF